MKKFWKVRADNFFKTNLESLSVDNKYINVLTDPSNSPLEYVNITNSKYIIVCYDSDEKYNKFGWDELENYNYFIRNDYKYCGIINIRKNKLNKLNDICKSTI